MKEEMSEGESLTLKGPAGLNPLVRLLLLMVQSYNISATYANILPGN